MQSESESSKTLKDLPQPEPSAGIKAYRDEIELALQRRPGCKENYLKFQANPRQPRPDYLPPVLDIENVSRCNYRCIMCMTSEFKNGKRGDDMSLEDFKKLIDEQYGLVEIKLHGIGEPTLQGDIFFEMIKYARAQNIWVRTVTNASLLHTQDRYRKLIDSGVNEVQISIDGATKETYEKIRRNGKFEKVVNNCKLINNYCKSQNLKRTKMWTVVQKDNLAELEALVELAADLGFDSLVFSLQMVAWGSDALADRNKRETVDSDLNYERLKNLIDQGDKLGVQVRFWQVADKYSAASPEMLCPWPFNRAFVTSDKRTVACCMIANPDIHEISQGLSFNDAWFGDEYAEFRLAHLEGRIPKVCKNCYINQ